MKVTSEQLEELKSLASPLKTWLDANGGPYTRIEITSEQIAVMDGIGGSPLDEEEEPAELKLPDSYWEEIKFQTDRLLSRMLVFGYPDGRLKHWMQQPNDLFNGRIPADLVKSGEGLEVFRIAREYFVS